MYFVGTRIFMSARSSVRWAAALAATLAAWPAGADPVPVCTANGCYAMISTPGNVRCRGHSSPGHFATRERARV